MDNIKQEIIKHWTEHAPYIEYERESRQEKRFKAEPNIKKLLDEFMSGESILEVGCGLGYDSDDAGSAGAVPGNH
jgi:hypothetical protein